MFHPLSFKGDSPRKTHTSGAKKNPIVNDSNANDEDINIRRIVIKSVYKVILVVKAKYKQ